MHTFQQLKVHHLLAALPLCDGFGFGVDQVANNPFSQPTNSLANPLLLGSSLNHAIQQHLLAATHCSAASQSQPLVLMDTLLSALMTSSRRRTIRINTGRTSSTPPVAGQCSSPQPLRWSKLADTAGHRLRACNRLGAMLTIIQYLSLIHI